MFGLIGAAARGLVGGVGRAGRMGAGGIAGVMARGMRPGRGTAPPAQPMSTPVGPAESLGSGGVETKTPSGEGGPTDEVRTFTSGPHQTMGGAMGGQFRGQGSDLRRFTRRQGRRAGRALSR